MLMSAVIVGTSLQIQKDGILSPHSIFLFSVIGRFALCLLRQWVFIFMLIK